VLEVEICAITSCTRCRILHRGTCDCRANRTRPHPSPTSLPRTRAAWPVPRPSPSKSPPSAQLDTRHALLRLARRGRAPRSTPRRGRANRSSTRTRNSIRASPLFRAPRSPSPSPRRSLLDSDLTAGTHHTIRAKELVPTWSGAARWSSRELHRRLETLARIGGFGGEFPWGAGELERDDEGEKWERHIWGPGARRSGRDLRAWVGSAVQDTSDGQKTSAQRDSQHPSTF
jgi:hypothetical protein